MRHYKAKRDLMLRLLGKASFINGSQFVIAWISPRGEVDVYASELLQTAVKPDVSRSAAGKPSAGLSKGGGKGAAGSGPGGIVDRDQLAREAKRIRGELGRRWAEFARLEALGAPVQDPNEGEGEVEGDGEGEGEEGEEGEGEEDGAEEAGGAALEVEVDDATPDPRAVSRRSIEVEDGDIDPDLTLVEDDFAFQFGETTTQSSFKKGYRPFFDSTSTSIEPSTLFPNPLARVPVPVSTSAPDAPIGLGINIGSGRVSGLGIPASSNTISVSPRPTTPAPRTPAPTSTRLPPQADAHTLVLPPGELAAYYTRRFSALQQSTCKLVTKAWIKVIEPKKQSKFPYKNGDGLKPGWWPEEIRHREPDHLNKIERLGILCAIVMHPQAPVTRLELSTAEAGCFISGPRQSILREVYLVAREHERKLKENDTESDIVVHLAHLPVSPSAVSPDVKTSKRSRANPVAAGPAVEVVAGPSCDAGPSAPPSPTAAAALSHLPRPDGPPSPLRTRRALASSDPNTMHSPILARLSTSNSASDSAGAGAVLPNGKKRAAGGAKDMSTGAILPQPIAGFYAHAQKRAKHLHVPAPMLSPLFPPGPDGLASAPGTAGAGGPHVSGAAHGQGETNLGAGAYGYAHPQQQGHNAYGYSFVGSHEASHGMMPIAAPVSWRMTDGLEVPLGHPHSHPHPHPHMHMHQHGYHPGHHLSPYPDWSAAGSLPNSAPGSEYSRSPNPNVDPMAQAHLSPNPHMPAPAPGHQAHLHHPHPERYPRPSPLVHAHSQPHLLVPGYMPHPMSRPHSHGLPSPSSEFYAQHAPHSAPLSAQGSAAGYFDQRDYLQQQQQLDYDAMQNTHAHAQAASASAGQPHGRRAASSSSAAQSQTHPLVLARHQHVVDGSVVQPAPSKAGTGHMMDGHSPEASLELARTASASTTRTLPPPTAVVAGPAAAVVAAATTTTTSGGVNDTLALALPLSAGLTDAGGYEYPSPYFDPNWDPHFASASQPAGI